MQVPKDCEKCFNVINDTSEAVDECLGIPDDVLALIAEAFTAISLDVETRWDLSPVIGPNRNVVQGAVSST